MTSGVPSGFDIHDVFTRLIPGGLLAGYFIVFSIGHELFVDSVSNEIVIFLFIMLAYITGESIDHIRRTRVPTPYLFQRLLYAETKNSDMLGRIDRIRLTLGDLPVIGRFVKGPSKPDTIMDSLDHNLAEEIKEDLPKFDSLTDREIFLIFTRMIRDSMGSNTLRYRSMYIFVVNMQISIYLSTLLAIIGLLFNSTADSLGPTLAILFGPLVMFYVIFMFKKIDHEYMDNLCLDYLEHKNSLENRGSSHEERDILQ
ncbi:hypothetical protein AB7C87_03320 [Natrarchaeobius sp. A-rgal3]|uniref:hypothetical protein n=1 Tax=Natrarchaeobius versutus TaxID=1679078 RepID=UPI003510783F